MVNIGKATTLFFCLVFALSETFAQNALHIPPTLSGTEFTLTLDEGTTEFTMGVETETIGYNGSYLGPTLIWENGTTVNIDVVNNMDEDTTTHWHGMHVPPEDDGHGHQLIPPGTTWSPSFDILDTASTMWYHPHVHENTMGQVNRGAAGMILIRDAEEAALNIPISYGIDEFPLILQDRQFDVDGQLVVQAQGNTMVINGTIDPFLDVPSQVVRFRILNGSNQRFYNLGFSDNRSFEIIGTDGGLFDAPVTVTRKILAPGQRADILVDFTGQNTQTVDIISYASEMPNDFPGSGGNGGLDGIDFSFLEINIGNQTATPITVIPANLATISPYTEADVENTRTLVMGGGGRGGFTLNGETFDMTVINQEVELNTTEAWVLVNDTNIAHPFHIHDIQFYVISRSVNGVPQILTDLESGHRQDTVIVAAGETVTFATKFDDFSDPNIPYMYHCHILPHEDAGMMGQFLVLDTSGTDDDTDDGNDGTGTGTDDGTGGDDTGNETDEGTNDEPSSVNNYFTDAILQASGWHYSPTIGFFQADSFPWVYIFPLGWAYAAGEGSGAYWFYMIDENSWAYTSGELYPTIYLSKTNDWAILLLETDPLLIYDQAIQDFRFYGQ